MAAPVTPKPVILVPFLYTEKVWAGGAVYLSNLVKTLSSLPKDQQPMVLLVNVHKGAMPDNLRIAAQEDAVAGIIGADGTLQAAKEWFRDLLVDSRTGQVSADILRRLIDGTDAMFPVPYPHWGTSGLRRPIYWIPDFQHKHLPEFFTQNELAQRDRLFSDITGSSVPLLLSSQAALDDCYRFFPEQRARCYVWPFCSNITPEEITSASNPVERYGLPQRYFYLANQFWAHKDHKTAFRALKILVEQGFDATFVCSGAFDDNRNRAYGDELQAFIAAEGLSDRIRLLGLLPRDEQIGLFRYAAAVIQPSRFEGWSTVVEDARALGRPVVLSDIPVHREQMGEGLFFRTGDAEDLARVIARNWDNLRPGPDLQREPMAFAAGLQRRQTCARQFLQIVAAERAIASKPSAQPAAATVKPATPSPTPAPVLQPLPQPRYTQTAARVAAVCHPKPAQGAEWYPPVMVGIDQLTTQLFAGNYVGKALELLERLDADAYTTYVAQFYRDGLRRFGENWQYADIVTVLMAVADLLKPQRYLEIGVRRGRSLCAVASRAPDCALYAFDMWIQGYAGMQNPGPDFVAQQLKLVGHRGPVRFTDGNSHETLPRFFAGNPDLMLDLITVDGDHSRIGAAQDLSDVLPRLAVGGVIVFDDICHPAHPELSEVWRTLVAEDPRYSAWSYADVGYGVGVAIRKY